MTTENTNRQTWTPAGAPRRPDLPFLVLPLAFATFAFGMLVCFGPHLAWQLLGAVGLASLVVACIATKRHWDRIGWYELRPIALPKLPFRVRCYFESATFGSDGAQFSKWPRRRFIAYSEIRRVETLCVGSTLEGVLIHFSAHPYHRTDNAPELLREGSMRGESSRRALAVLRQMAPHAIFLGPQWIEEGWVPRAGFTRVYPSGGGGA